MRARRELTKRLEKKRKMIKWLQKRRLKIILLQFSLRVHVRITSYIKLQYSFFTRGEEPKSKLLGTNLPRVVSAPGS